MVIRTNSKLTPAGIQIIIKKIEPIGTKNHAYVSQSKVAELNLLLNQDFQRGTDKTLRVFLIKSDADGGLGSWTFDPTTNEEWQGAIFITELFNDNSDDAYSAQYYLPSNDTLLHELGHVLMQEANHYSELKLNFFHEYSLYTDDSITSEQIKRLRGEDNLRPAGSPNYLVQRP